MMKIAIGRHFHLEENNFYSLSCAKARSFLFGRRETHKNQRKKFSFFDKTIEQKQEKQKKGKSRQNNKKENEVSSRFQVLKDQDGRNKNKKNDEIFN